MKKTIVVNCRTKKFDVFIGRPTIYGNPYKIGLDGNREEVIKKYREYFYNRIKIDNLFKKAIKKLKNKILGCFCKPNNACHGDIIKEFLENE